MNSAYAEPSIRLGLPVQITGDRSVSGHACHWNVTCWVVNYVDQDPGSQALDYACGHRTYNGHDGNDFGLRNLAQMEAGVSVIATAVGTVKSVRDGMPDVSIRDAQASPLQGRDCGNGVVIDHGQGWMTQYCHLKQGSIRVHAGEFIQEGQMLGLIGLSGNTEFPHVHLTVRYQGRPVDLFTGNGISGSCGKTIQPLWKESLLSMMTYQPLIIRNMGVSGIPPSVQDIRKGTDPISALSAKSPALILWVDTFGIEKGDQVTFQIIDPSGKTLLTQMLALSKTQAAWFGYAGKRRTQGDWPEGTYQGIVTLNRPNKASRRQVIDFKVNKEI